MDSWVAQHAAAIEADATQRLQTLVDISSPSGDVAGAEACIAAILPWLPAEAIVERPECSSPGHAPDLLARVRGTGTGRVLLLGHVDTVVGHDEHRPAAPDPHRPGVLVGSGTIDMKGGDVLALGVLRALAERPADFGEVALLLVCDEEWRRTPFRHGATFAGWDACLCFEAGELTEAGEDAVVVRRKAAATVRVTAEGRSAHSGASPDDGANALLALAAAAQAAAATHAPQGADHRTVVPTVLRSGDAFNVVPAAGELLLDVRADRLEAVEEVLAALPAEVGGATLHPAMLRTWPGMDAREAAADVLRAAGERLGRPVLGRARGGASDAAHLAPHVPVTIDGLGPLGALAHHPGEHLLVASLRSRAEVALAVADAVLDPRRP
jgi:glutamate carboxypeptidase